MVQGALVEAVKRWDSLRDPSAREGWLRRIVVNRVWSYLRRRRFWNAVGAVLLVAEEQVAPPPDEAAEQREHQVRLSAELEKLPARQSLAFTLRYLEADLKRAQLDLQRTLAQAQVDEPAVMNKLEVVSRAELAVRKNRMGLMVRIRKAVGPEAWEKLQAEMPGPGAGMMMGGGGPGRREIRIIRTDEGGENIDVRGE